MFSTRGVALQLLGETWETPPEKYSEYHGQSHAVNRSNLVSATIVFDDLRCARKLDGRHTHIQCSHACPTSIYFPQVSRQGLETPAVLPAAGEDELFRACVYTLPCSPDPATGGCARHCILLEFLLQTVHALFHIQVWIAS